MAKTPTTCGIDLGTTNSLVAYVDPVGRPLSIANFTGDIMTPSMIYFEGDEVVVGTQAKRGGQEAPERFAECFKRSMGEDWYPDPIAGKRFRPEVLSALILKRLHAEAQRHLGQAQRAVITVPAYFDECRRRATKNAGTIAGWDVVDIINEPTAAAIAYAYRAGQLGKADKARERILIYDLGGGTFDTTVLELTQGREYRTLATEGEVRLGGQDWDEWLREHLAGQFKSKTGVDPLANTRGAFEFFQIARSTKHALSLRKSVTTPTMYQGKRALLEIDQDGFEKGTAHLLRRSQDTTEIVLGEAKLRWSDIDAVFMTGGSTRMPMVERMLQGLTGKPPRNDLSADEAVAHGAAVYAHLLGQPNCPKVINVNAHSYRLACVRQGKSIAHSMIPKNSPLPKERAITIPVANAGIDTIHVNILEGESEDTKLCAFIGRVRIEGLPKDTSKRWLVSLALRCQEDGKIAVSAAVKDPADPKSIVCQAKATLESQHGMNPAEIAEAQRYVSGLQIA